MKKYGERCTKTKPNSDDKAIFHENYKYYLQVFLDECLHKI